MTARLAGFVAHLDAHGVVLAHRVDHDAPGLRLARLPAPLWTLDAVVHGVAGQVHQRVTQALGNPLRQRVVARRPLRIDGEKSMARSVPRGSEKRSVKSSAPGPAPSEVSLPSAPSTASCCGA